MYPLQPGVRHAKLFREGGPSLLRDGLSQFVLTPLRLLQRAHSRCKDLENHSRSFLEEKSINRNGGFYKYDRDKKH